MNKIMNESHDKNLNVKKIQRRTSISQWYFNPVLMPLYDFIVYRFVSEYIWGCSNDLLIKRYRHYVDKNHLEVGVGTGYLLDKSNPVDISLDLMDLSLSCLEQSGKRLSRYSPKIIRHNILEAPLEEDKRYDSIGINYVLHCVAGDYTVKGIAFTNLKSLLKDKGVLFGACVLRTNSSSRTAKFCMGLLNKLGIFNTFEDEVDDLVRVLKKNFRYVKVEIISAVVLFEASDHE